VRFVSGEPLIDVSSFCRGGDEDRFPTRWIALDRGVCHATFGGARPSLGRVGRGQGQQNRFSSRGTSV